jgi:hypothetical protein
VSEKREKWKRDGNSPPADCDEGSTKEMGGVIQGEWAKCESRKRVTTRDTAEGSEEEKEKGERTCPNSMIFSGSPPKLAIFCLIHLSACRWS